MKKHSTLCWQTLTPWDRSCPWPESWGWGRSPLLPRGSGPQPEIRRPAPFAPEQLGQMGRLLELFQASRQSNQEADALIAALRPFLREERQKKLDQAIQLAGLSRAARQAYRLWKEGELHL
ncbi:MAG: hypothetical protein ACLTC3_15205 [Evtepia gabavorous]